MQNVNYYYEAIGCYAKALQIEESKEIHRKASKLFITFISPFVEVDPKSAIEWGRYLDQLESLERFCLEAEDREFFYRHAKKKMNAFFEISLMRNKQNILPHTKE